MIRRQKSGSVSYIVSAWASTADRYDITKPPFYHPCFSPSLYWINTFLYLTNLSSLAIINVNEAAKRIAVRSSSLVFFENLKKRLRLTIRGLFSYRQISLVYLVARIIVATSVPNPITTVNIDNTNWSTL